MDKKKIAIALQGGGAHGAYTWGVIEKLLEEDVLDIRGICGTSAGAVNAAIIVHGLQKNGNKGAIELMEKFWKEVSLSSSLFIAPQQQWIDNNLFKGNMDFSPYYQLFNFITNQFSPAQFNPTGLNPLKTILGKLIDFKELNTSKIKLYTAATNVRTGSPKVFSFPDVNLDALLASSCLPYLFKTVEINGEFYWDGGYSGNPPIYPLIYGTDAKDIMLIQIIPINRKKIPSSNTEIFSRINEISFNASLRAEMRMIMGGYDLGGEIKDIYFQAIPSDNVFKDLDFSSTLNTSWEFINKLRMEGREAAALWIKNDLAFVGQETCPMLKDLFGQVEKDWMHEMVHKHRKLTTSAS